MRKTYWVAKRYLRTLHAKIQEIVQYLLGVSFHDRQGSRLLPTPRPFSSWTTSTYCNKHPSLETSKNHLTLKASTYITRSWTWDGEDKPVTVHQEQPRNLKNLGDFAGHSPAERIWPGSKTVSIVEKKKWNCNHLFHDPSENT